MKLRNGQLFRSETVRNCFTLLSAGSLSQLIAIVVYPIVTRQYNPDELGVLSLFLSIVGVGTILASAKYEPAIMVEKNERDAAAVFDLCFVINIALCLFILVAFVFFKPLIVSTFQLDSIAEFLYFIPLLIFLSAFGFVFTYWLNRNNRFRVTARYNLVQSTTNSSLKIVFGTLGFTRWGLIASTVLGQLIGVFSIFLQKKDYNRLFKFDRFRIKTVAVRQVDFPKYTLPHSFINTLAGNLPIMILAAYFNMPQVGLFSLGITVGFKPITLFAGSINQVLFQRVSQHKTQGIDSYPLLKNFCKKVLFIGLPAVVVLYFTLPSLVCWIFGTEWIEAGEYMQLMLPWFFAVLLASPLSFMPAVAAQQRKAMLLEIAYTVLRISALFIGVLSGDIRTAIMLFSLVSAGFVFGILFWYLSLAKNIEK